MKSGELPPREGERRIADCACGSDSIMVEINGSREELSVPDAISFAARILALAEVMLRNG